MSKVLVSYFSASGVTEGVAKRVATAVNADLFEIEPVEKYLNKLMWDCSKYSNFILYGDLSYE